MTEYQKKVRSTIQQQYPDFWQRMQLSQLERNPMLLGYWQLLTKQSHRQGLAPAGAAKRFILATRRKHLH